ncbi:HGGxSTG domain-containing protein [Falsiroseomonas sp.]|uniref:HGGxSTG domain-containing protein n=1 Tax=Falsiroseomonas sp. TaxID=2870721 RepID=UPI003561A118
MGTGTVRAPVPAATGPMQASPRCGARTRGGTPCRAPAVKGRRRCRMHGGAKGSGAPRYSQNALKHGLTTAEAKAERREIGELIRTGRRVLKEMDDF